MSVRMTGGSSGNREDALPNVPTSGSPQPVLDTSGYAKQPGVRMTGGSTGNREANALPDVPTSGTVPESSTDVCDPGAHR